MENYEDHHWGDLKTDVDELIKIHKEANDYNEALEEVDINTIIIARKLDNILFALEQLYKKL